MNVSVLIPYLDASTRRRPLELVESYWREAFPDFQLFVARIVGEPPFNKAWVVNAAARGAIEQGADVLICADADSLVQPQQIAAALARVEDGPVSAFSVYRRLTREETDRLAGWPQAFGCSGDWSLDASGSTGAAVLTSGQWQAIGGMDEGFPLPYYEDLAFWTTARALYSCRRIEGPLVHLWHERDEGRWPQLEQFCRARYMRYEAAAPSDIRAMRAIRDDGIYSPLADHVGTGPE